MNLSQYFSTNVPAGTLAQMNGFTFGFAIVISVALCASICRLRYGRWPSPMVTAAAPLILAAFGLAWTALGLANPAQLDSSAAFAFVLGMKGAWGYYVVGLSVAASPDWIGALLASRAHRRNTNPNYIEGARDRRG
jgi:hypothetical protein